MEPHEPIPFRFVAAPQEESQREGKISLPVLVRHVLEMDGHTVSRRGLVAIEWV